MLELADTISRLDDWIQKNGDEGWDPYDVKGTAFAIGFQRAQPRFITSRVRRVADLGINHFPLTARRLLGVKPQANAKAMGLLLSAYINLYNASNKREHVEKARYYARWLLENRGCHYSGYNWGYPFDWQSVAFIPRGTPSSVVTATIGDGFYRIYKATGESRYLDVCKGICEFITTDLIRSVDTADKLCFSYTPIYDSQVHNANLYAGEFLVRTGKEIGHEGWIETGIRCGNFAISEQQDEGFLPYTGLAQLHKHGDGRMVTDHYHSGFEIRMLYGLWKHTSLRRFERAYRRYLEWYLENMFVDGYKPKINSTRFYPVNIHACAESILCPATLLPDHPELRINLASTVKWVVETMEYAPGAYAYMIKSLPILGKWKLRIPMLRWGQAWMLRALSQVALEFQEIVRLD